MKLVVLAFAALVLGAAPAYADEEKEDPSITMLRQMLECQAVGLSLMQMYNSMAASIDVLAPEAPSQLQMLRDSYLMMAKDQEARVHQSIELTRENLFPQLEPAIQMRYPEELAKAIVNIQKALSLSAYEKQKQVQGQLLSTSHDCEALTEKLINSTL